MPGHIPIYMNIGSCMKPLSLKYMLDSIIFFYKRKTNLEKRMKTQKNIKVAYTIFLTELTESDSV